jgi:hypothetical protein
MIFFIEEFEVLSIRLAGILEGCGKAVLELMPSIFCCPPMTEVLFFL